MPYLARTRRLDVAQLDAEPQKDLRSVHAILLSGISDVDERLRLLELAYYGTGHSSIDELTRQAADVRPMLAVAGVTAFVSAEQVNEATRRRDADADALEPVVSTAVSAQSSKPSSVAVVQAAAGASSDKAESGHAEDAADVASPRSAEEDNANNTADQKTQPATGSSTKTTAQGEIQVPLTAATKPAEDDALFTLSRTLRDALRKVLDVVPDGFEELVADTRRLQRNLRKYCVSFYQVDADADADGAGQTSPVLLETAAKYELEIRRRLSSIDSSLGDIRSLSDRFRKSELYVADFGQFGVELSRRTGSAHAPFLMLFPAAVNSIRTALGVMRDWVSDDAAYAEFIGNDVRDLERRLKVTDRRLVALRATYHQVAFRARQMNTACEQLHADVKKTQGREDELVVDEELLTAETDELRTEEETTEFRRNELERHAAYYTPEDYFSKLNELTDRLRQIRQRLPVAEQTLASVRQKLAQLALKRQRFKAESKRLSTVEAERDELSARVSEDEVERDAMSLALDKARRIWQCKRSSDAVAKIFYDRPVHVSNASRLPAAGHHQDQQAEEFDGACKLISARIDRDWPSLYRSLPFYPPRGVTTVDRDVAELDDARDPPAVAAERALTRWRRFHTRACADDLATALGRCGRADLERRVRGVGRQRRASDAAAGGGAAAGAGSGDVPDWVEQQLVPYWREIERFDQLRAAHRQQTGEHAETLFV